MPKFFYILVALTLALASACSGSEFAGGLVGRERADKAEDGGAIKVGDEQQGELDEEEVDDPQQIAGAFLTLECVEDPALVHDDVAVTIGCVVKDQTGAKADLSAATDQTWELWSPLNFTLPKPFAEEDAASAYHRTVSVSRAFMSLHSVRSRFVLEGQERNLVTGVEPKKQASGAGTGGLPGPGLPTQEVGTNEDFQLGDGDWDPKANKGCTNRLQTVGVIGKQMAAKLTVASATANVGIVFKDVCGVTVDSNGAKLVQAGNIVSEGQFAKYADSMALPGVNLQQGEYEIVFESGVAYLRNDGTPEHDDYVVGRIVVTTDGDVKVERPQLVP